MTLRPKDFTKIPKSLSVKIYHGGGSFDIQKWLSKNNPFSTTGIPGELHFYIPLIMSEAASFMGPGTNLKLRLDEHDRPHDWSEPINGVDYICYIHDLDYRKSEDGLDLETEEGKKRSLDLKHEADAKMLKSLDQIDAKGFVEKSMKFVGSGIIGFKLRQGFGLDSHEKVFKAIQMTKNKVRDKNIAKIDWSRFVQDDSL